MQYDEQYYETNDGGEDVINYNDNVDVFDTNNNSDLIDQLNVNTTNTDLYQMNTNYQIYFDDELSNLDTRDCVSIFGPANSHRTCSQYRNADTNSLRIFACKQLISFDSFRMKLFLFFCRHLVK